MAKQYTVQDPAKLLGKLIMQMSSGMMLHKDRFDVKSLHQHLTSFSIVILMYFNGNARSYKIMSMIC